MPRLTLKSGIVVANLCSLNNIYFIGYDRKNKSEYLAGCEHNRVRDLHLELHTEVSRGAKGEMLVRVETHLSNRLKKAIEAVHSERYADVDYVLVKRALWDAAERDGVVMDKLAMYAVGNVQGDVDPNVFYKAKPSMRNYLSTYLGNAHAKVDDSGKPISGDNGL